MMNKLKLIPHRLVNVCLRSMASTRTMPGKKIQVLGVDVHYEKVGDGDHAVLLLPNVMGSTKTSFSQQLQKWDKKKMTMIALDPPGQGFSRPPEKEFGLNMFKRDAEFAGRFMDKLGYEKYSVVGYSNGGIIAIILAAKRPKNVQKLVSISARAFITTKEIDHVIKYRDTTLLSDSTKKEMSAIYEGDYFQRMWSKWCVTYDRIYQRTGGTLCMEEVPLVKCPTLVTHGSKDDIFLVQHAEYLHRNIKKAKMELFPDAGHALHLQFPEKFNPLVEKFLLDEN